MSHSCHLAIMAHVDWTQAVCTVSPALSFHEGAQDHSQVLSARDPLVKYTGF